METASWWEWDEDSAELFRLCEWEEHAPKTPGFYELGFLGPPFKPMYGGKAAKQTLSVRLDQEFNRSHNEHIRRHSHELWFRFKPLTSRIEADVFEGLFLACYGVREESDRYPWNQRNEWKQQWAMES